MTDEAVPQRVVELVPDGLRLHLAQVPTEQFGCSGVTCWRRLRDWTEVGVWPQLHQVLLEELRAGKLDLDTAVEDGSHVRAIQGGLTPALRRWTGPATDPSTTSSPTPAGFRWS